MFVRAASLLALAAGAGAVRVREGLVDNPIQTGIAPQYLDGEGWLLSNTNGSIVVGASVPGDIVTDLEANNVIGDPIFETTWKNAIWDLETWTYSLTFDSSLPAPSTMSAALLVFDGIKMGSHVTLNGVALGDTSDQFLRYIFEVAPASLKAKGNVLTVAFPVSSDPLNADNRFMSCSGGWDWAPYAAPYQKTSTGSSTFSKGASTQTRHTHPPARPPLTLDNPSWALGNLSRRCGRVFISWPFRRAAPPSRTWCRWPITTAPTPPRRSLTRRTRASRSRCARTCGPPRPSRAA
jgi:hypothetical protein